MRVVVVNAKGGQALGPPLARWLKHRKPRRTPLVALVSEADGPNHASDRIVDAVSVGVPKTRIFHGTQDHGAREVAVMTRGGRYRVTAHETRQLTKGHGWNGATQDRWATIVSGVLDRKHLVAFVSVHAPTRRQSRILKPLAAILEELTADGYQVVIGGDMNRTDGPLSPVRRWAKKHGLNAYATHVMWVFTTPGLDVTHAKAMPLDAAISDHPTAISIRITPKGKP